MLGTKDSHHNPSAEPLGSAGTKRRQLSCRTLAEFVQTHTGIRKNTDSTAMTESRVPL
jgi:hypothetical protein